MAIYGASERWIAEAILIISRSGLALSAHVLRDWRSKYRSKFERDWRDECRKTAEVR